MKIRTSANTDINTIFGAVINENLNDEIIVTVIATGFDQKEEKKEMQEAQSAATNIFDSSDDDDDVPNFLRKRVF